MKRAAMVLIVASYSARDLAAASPCALRSRSVTLMSAAPPGNVRLPGAETTTCCRVRSAGGALMSDTTRLTHAASATELPPNLLTARSIGRRRGVLSAESDDDCGRQKRDEMHKLPE
eukprot:scaffold61359_cov34-Phaeocystis_antarctica.AAC.1